MGGAGALALWRPREDREMAAGAVFEAHSRAAAGNVGGDGVDGGGEGDVGGLRIFDC